MGRGGDARSGLSRYRGATPVIRPHPKTPGSAKRLRPCLHPARSQGLDAWARCARLVTRVVLVVGHQFTVTVGILHPVTVPRAWDTVPGVEEGKPMELDPEQQAELMAAVQGVADAMSDLGAVLNALPYPRVRPRFHGRPETWEAVDGAVALCCELLGVDRPPPEVKAARARLDDAIAAAVPIAQKTGIITNNVDDLLKLPTGPLSRRGTFPGTPEDWYVKAHIAEFRDAMAGVDHVQCPSGHRAGAIVAADALTFHTEHADCVHCEAMSQVMVANALEEAEPGARCLRIIHLVNPNGSYRGYTAEPLELGVFRARAPKLGRNDPCHCGSGKKFKHCHGRGEG